MDLTPLQWLFGLLGALLVGLGKGGLAGVGNLAMVFFAHAFPAKASVGMLLPVLITADLVAITIYRRHAQWAHVFRLLPWVAVGIVAGYFLLGRMGDEQVRFIIGGFLLVMAAFHFFRRWQLKRSGLEDTLPHHPLFIATMGTLAGLATMMANAAGPFAAVFFLAAGLPKLHYIGTAAWFFFLVNCMKMPLQAHLGMVTFESLGASLAFAPAAIAGGLIAPFIVRYIAQNVFEALIWVFIIVGGLTLLL